MAERSIQIPRGSLLYLYGIVPADAPDPPRELKGIGSAGVRLVPVGDLRAVVSEVPPDEYAAEAIDRRMEEVEWVGARGLEHERVLTWFADRCPVLPFSLFSLHRDETALVARIEERMRAIVRALDALRGHREWGIRIRADVDRVAAQVDRLSSRLAPLREEMDEAPPGRRFLLGKKLDALRSDEARRLSRERAEAAYARLEIAAAGAVRKPVVQREAGRRVVLDAAFLVGEGAYERFQAEVNAAAAHLTEAGMEIEFTGPWPAYHFSRLQDDSET